MSPPKYVRSSSHGRRVLPVHTKPSKPPALKRTAQGNKSGIGLSKTVGKQVPAIDQEDEDMACLPHYCAMCEKQILTPGSSILYCSESCRRKDGNKPLTRASVTLDHSPLPTSPSSLSSFDLHSYPDIIPQRSPTVPRPTSLAFSDSSESSTFEHRPYYGRTESEAARYLAQFGSPNTSPERKRRPRYERAQTSTSHTTLPSLSHTPGSMTSPSSSYSSTRPLPSRTNPYGASFSSRSVDLVTPLAGIPSATAPANMNIESTSFRSSASTVTAFGVVEAGLSYEKKPYSAEASPGKGSLKKLFSPN